MTQQTASASKDAKPQPGLTVAAEGRAPLGLDLAVFHQRFEALTARARDAEATATACSASERARALRRRAGFELLLDPAQSLRTLANARLVEGSLAGVDDRRQQVLRETLARCYALEAVDVDEVGAIFTARPARGEADPEAGGRQLLIPWLIALGETALARRWLDAAWCGESDERAESQRRQLDVLEQAWLAADGRFPTTSASLLREGATVTPSVWLQVYFNAYWQVLGGNPADVRFTCQLIDGLTSRMPPAFHTSAAISETVLRVLEGSEEITVAPPRYQLTLLNIGPILAGGEAIAVGGTRECAATWSDWFASSWPAAVLRASSWPVLNHRVRALLACRAGDTASGLRLMDQAIDVADRIGSHIEAALARVQYAELLALDPQREVRERWRGLDRSGRDRCRALGIPVEHHAHRARTAATLGRFDSASRTASTAAPAAVARLTSRELEVLRLFSAGDSYREAGLTLGVGWRTVQSHAYNAYQKLGVSSKIAAVGAATRLGLL